jgi:hypothetical protein
MSTRRSFPIAGAFAAILLLAGCGSSGVDGILGGGSSSGVNEIRGTVDLVDPNGRYIVVTGVETGSTRLRQGASGVRLYFDNRTVVEYQGRSYRPEDLERGDRIAARVTPSGDGYATDRITVTYNVSGGTGTSTSGGYYADLRGTVSYIDTRNRVLEIDRAPHGSRADVVRVEYDTNTTVQFQGRAYRPDQLERGDTVEIATTNLGGGRLRANQIHVVSSVSGGTGTTGTAGAMGDVRGTVTFVDTRNRTVELERTSWTSRFSTGGTAGTPLMVRYDTSTIVEYQGRNYAPENLERGDVIDVRLRTGTGSTLLADRIYVVADVRR